MTTLSLRNISINMLEMVLSIFQIYVISFNAHKALQVRFHYYVHFKDEGR